MANTLEIVVKARDQASSTLRGVHGALAGFQASAQPAVAALRAVGTAAGVAFVAAAGAVTAFGVDAVKTAVSIESAFAGVIKTTDGLTSSYGVLNEQGQALKRSFKELAETIPVSVEELMKIGELGGQIGIAKEDLIDFTATVAAMAASTSLSSDEAATSMARFMNIMTMPSSEISNLGSVIVELGNKLAATEPEILEFGTRIAGAGKIVGMSEASVMAIAGAFSSVGVQAEAGGTAVQKVLLDIHAAAQRGGDALAGYARTAGMSAQEFGDMWKKDAGAAFAAFVAGLGKQGDQAIMTLEELGINDARQVRGFLALAGAGDLVTRSMDMANVAWEENLALTTEAGQRFATTESQMQLLRNQWRNAKDELGAALLPALQELVKVLSGIVKEYGPAIVAVFQDKIVPAIGSVVMALGMLAQGDLSGALGQLFGEEIAGKIMAVVDAIALFVGQISAFVGQHAEEFKGALIAIGAVLATAAIASAIASIGSAIAALANPIGLIIAAVALLGAAWAGNWGGIQEKTRAVIDWITPYIQIGLDAIRQFWDENGAQIMATVTAVWGLIKEIFTITTEAIKAVVSAALAAIKVWWDEHGDAVMAVVQFMWNTIQTIFQTSLTTIQLLVQAVQAAMHGDWEAFGEALRAIVETIWSAVRDIFVKWFETLKTVVRDVVESIKSAWTSVDWKGIGKNIIEGIKNGVISAAKSLANAAAKAARDALNAAKAALGIGSPSKVAAEQIGVPFIEGIGVGVERAMRDLERVQMPGVGRSMLQGVSRGATAAQNSTTTTNNSYNLTIHTNAPSEPILADFALMRAMA